MQQSQWVVDGESAPSKPAKLKVIDYIEPVIVSDDRPAGEKKFAENYNLMIETLIANKLMKSK